MFNTQEVGYRMRNTRGGCKVEHLRAWIVSEIA